VRGGVVAYLLVNGASKASEFYQRAFGATEVARQPAGARAVFLRAIDGYPMR
jgi:uncharacterized glyoxalase superfamily protein PhnB